MIKRPLRSSYSFIWLASLLLAACLGVQGQAFQCANATGVPPVVRAEGFAELIGDIVLDCTGGIPTPPNQLVPMVNIAVNLDTFLSSRVTAVIGQVEFLDSLLLVDEPNSASNPSTPILNCGRTEAPDTTQAGPGICSIVGGGSLGAANTYNGTVNHPNVFQGRSFSLITGQTNQVVFASIPIDPPGTICSNSFDGQCHRIIRITNIRGDATTKGVIQANQTSTLTAALIMNPVPVLPLDNPTSVVGRVQVGLVGSTGSGSVVVREGFGNAFKARSLTQVLANGVAKPAYGYSGTPNAIPDVNNNQNVPGAVYDTESAFTDSLDSTHGDAPTNALTSGTGAGVPLSNVGSAFNTGINNAGVADSGTRIALKFDIPPGASVQVPQTVPLQNVIGQTVLGVMMLTNADSSGAGPLSPATGILSAANNIAVYEVLFANPNALEFASVPVTLLNAPSNTTLHVTTSLAPFFSPTYAVRNASATLPVARFINSTDAFCLIGCISVSPNQGPNSGPLNTAVFGSPILNNAQVKLSRAGFPDIPGTATSNSNPSFLSATFDLTGAPAGPRDIVVTPQAGSPVTYSGLFNITAAPTSCSYEVGVPFSADLTVPASGGSGDLVVTTRPSTCSWGASTNTPWITLPPKSNPVTQPYIVDANPDSTPRVGAITIAGRQIFVSQGACTYDISPASQIFPADGGNVSVNVTAPAGCQWSAFGGDAWTLLLGGTSGSGSGLVILQAAPNSGGVRSTAFTIAGKTFTASQGAASACGATDASSQVSVIRGVFLSNFLGSAYTQQVKLTNNGPAVQGPVYLVVDGLVAGSVALTARTTTCQSHGTSYMVLAAPNGLTAGQLVNLTLTFQPGLAAKGAPPTWTTTRVFSGTPSQ